MESRSHPLRQNSKSAARHRRAAFVYSGPWFIPPSVPAWRHGRAMCRRAGILMNASLRDAGNRKKFRDAWNASRAVGARIRLGPDLDLRLVPDSFLSAAFLQLDMHVAAGGKLHACSKCSAPFTSGTGTGRRKIRNFAVSRAVKKPGAHATRPSPCRIMLHGNAAPYRK